MKDKTIIVAGNKDYKELLQMAFNIGYVWGGTKTTDIPSYQAGYYLFQVENDRLTVRHSSNTLEVKAFTFKSNDSFIVYQELYNLRDIVRFQRIINKIRSEIK